MRSFACVTLTAAALAWALCAAASPSVREIDSLEQAVAAEPENLKLAADYRQLAISEKAFDRSIALFENLARLGLRERLAADL